MVLIAAVVAPLPGEPPIQAELATRAIVTAYEVTLIGVVASEVMDTVLFR